MIQGTLFALAACFIWGFIFIIPTFMKEFDVLEIALGRHFVYGSTSVLFLLVTFKKFKRYSIKTWRVAFSFALVANIFYYSCVVTGVNWASPTLTTLILGMSPIVISFFGNWLEKDCHFKELLIPAALIFIGLIAINLPELQQEDPLEKPKYWLGALAAFCSLAAWSWYAVINARFLKNNPHISPIHWSTMMGVSTFCWVILLGSIYESFQGGAHWQQFTAPSSALFNYILGCLILGTLCSWLGSFLWNNACTRLPVSFAGELSIFETLFGLLFFYLLEKEWPEFYETAGIFLMLSAVVYSMQSTAYSRAPLPQNE